jgi:hypothetical protein
VLRMQWVFCDWPVVHVQLPPSAAAQRRLNTHCLL